MITVVVKDALRARVEAASGGAQTVLYTRRGQPSHVNIILREHLGLGEHPAFMLRGQPRQEFFYGTYPGVIRDGELLSLPGQPPASGIDFATASRAARACGGGWHLSTNAERAALMRWGNAQGLASQGNTDHGRDIRDGAAHGRRVDAAVSGDPAGNPATLTGSGPDSWRHDHTPHGIAVCAETSGNGKRACAWWTARSRSLRTTTPLMRTWRRTPRRGWLSAFGTAPLLSLIHISEPTRPY